MAHSSEVGAQGSNLSLGLKHLPFKPCSDFPESLTDDSGKVSKTKFMFTIWTFLLNYNSNWASVFVKWLALNILLYILHIESLIHIL